jgi:hypothetical protein
LRFFSGKLRRSFSVGPQLIAKIVSAWEIVDTDCAEVIDAILLSAKPALKALSRKSGARAHDVISLLFANDALRFFDLSRIAPNQSSRRARTRQILAKAKRYWQKLDMVRAAIQEHRGRQ